MRPLLLGRIHTPVDLAADLSQAVLRQRLTDQIEELIRCDNDLSTAPDDDLRAALLALIARMQGTRPRPKVSITS